MSYIGKAPNVNRLRLNPRSSDPVNPAEGDLQYADGSARKEGLWVYKDSAWSEVGGTSSGSKNYLSTYLNNTGNGDFEAGTLGWSLGTTGALTNSFPSGTPTFGSGASGNLSISTVNSGQLAGLLSLSYASSAATTVGNCLASNAFTIDLEDQSKVLTFKFFYKAFSGASTANWSGTSSNSFGVAIYDVTNSAWIQPAGLFGMTQSSGVGICTGTFQTTSNSTSYRIVVYNANATSGAVTLYFDDFSLGPQTAPLGAVVTDPVAYTPTFAGLGTPSSVQVEWSRRGKYLKVDYKFSTGTVTAATASISLPSGLSIDTSILSGTCVVGYSQNNSGVADLVVLAATATSTTNVYFARNTTGALAPILGNASPFANSQLHAGWFEVPISGWSSNVQMSNDTDTRIVAARYYSTAGQSFADNVVTIVNYDTKEFDTHAAVTTGASWTFTCPVSGYYQVSYGWAYSSAAGNQIAYLYKNGSVYARIYQDVTSNAGEKGCFALAYCNAGDTLQPRMSQNAGGSRSLDTTAANNFITINRLSGPAVVAATESVNAIYTDTAGSSIGTSAAVYKFSTKVRDSHNAYSTSNGLYTAPVSGYYRFSAAMWTASVNLSTSQSFKLLAYVNGSTLVGNMFAMGTGVSRAQATNMLGAYYLNAGDTLQIQAVSDVATSASTTTGVNWFSIERVGN